MISQINQIVLDQIVLVGVVNLEQWEQCRDCVKERILVQCLSCQLFLVVHVQITTGIKHSQNFLDYVVIIKIFHALTFTSHFLSF